MLLSLLNSQVPEHSAVVMNRQRGGVTRTESGFDKQNFASFNI